MKIFSVLFLFLAFTAQPLQAAVQPLKIGVDTDNPPFAMEGTNSQLYGFDISMMEYICKTLQRPCKFIPLHFDHLIDAVKTKEIDVATASIAITSERSLIVNFSTPYLLSPARFIGSVKLNKQPFSLELLNNKKIGILQGSTFPLVINTLGIKNPQLVPYADLTDLIDDLNNEKIDIGLLDDPSAMYWQAQSSGRLIVLGQPFVYGMGLGIAINREDLTLLKKINDALKKYKSSESFKENLKTYLTSF